MSEISKVFVIHYSKLSERRKHMESQMAHWFPNTEYEFITEFDQEVLDEPLLLSNFDRELFFKKFNRDFLPSEMSLCLKYKLAIKKAFENGGDQFMILEDDVIFKQDPINYLRFVNAAISYHNILMHCLFLGEALIRKGDNRNILVKKGYPATNGLCTVMYTKDAIIKLHDHLYLSGSKISQPMDWEFNDVFEKLGLEVFWGKAITQHGSVLAEDDGSFAQFKSTLRDKY